MLRTLILGLTLVGTAALANWGGKELTQSIEFATDAFEADIGKDVFADHVIAIEASLTTTKKAANVKITYMDGAAQKEKKYFCHTHGNDIDCH